MRQFAFLISFIVVLLGIGFSQKKVVVLDAGHGGKDPGTIYYGIKEKDIALKIVLLTGEYVEKYLPNVKVVYTRKTDVFIELNQRANIAVKNKADLFISIHVNSSSNKQIQGTEIYIMGLHKTQENLQVAMRENSVINLEANNVYNFDPLSPESYIIFNINQNLNLDQSLEFAEILDSQFKNRAKRVSRGVKQAGFLVLWNVTMPAILIEVGFLSNKNEAKFLNSKYGQEIIASAIYRAIKEYFKNN